ncbi:hypothetical protein PFISCL1PPCAC_23987, partial [Pristionchus fissidentatus]
NEYTYKMACPAGLFYDASNKRCDIRENIVACGGNPTQPAVAPLPVRDAPAVPVAPIPVQHSDNFCVGKPEGEHAVGCAGFYYSCQNGYTYKMACPSGLYYDAPNKRCDIRENIVACGKLPQPVISPITSLPVRDVPTVIPVTPVPVKHSEKFCTGKADGEHSAGCNNFYYSCQNEYTYKMACPAGLFYDASNKRCDMRENIVTCGGNPT